jgi:hypothetical protein
MPECGQDSSVAGFEVLAEARMKMAVFWVVAPCSLVEGYNVSEVLPASVISPMSNGFSWLKIRSGGEFLSTQ